MAHLLYLIRHAIAEPHGPSQQDADRSLTAEGEARMRRIVLGLKRLNVAPDVVWSSPLRRAQQTAEIVRAALAPDIVIATCDALAPGSGSGEVLGRLRAARGVSSLALVGHEPDLGELATHLLVGSPARAALAFKKGGVAAIEVDALPPSAPGTLRWLLTPKQLCALAQRASRH